MKLIPCLRPHFIPKADEDTRRLVERLSLHPNASDVYASAVMERRKAEWLLHRALKQSQGHSCVKRLLSHCDGRHCLFPPGNDHPSLWLFDGKPIVYVFQPYGMNQSDVEGLVTFCQVHQLSFDIDTWPAWHYPNRVLHVEIWRKGGPYPLQVYNRASIQRLPGEIEEADREGRTADAERLRASLKLAREGR